ncbi:MAG: trypsin-like peptidase domain-containing protein, partial [Planctomycetales bacterium]|nr:trypsin-like peptidase domain-containing protein [Planctomycetales bacterium]
VTPIPIAGSDYHVASGQRLFSVGCNHGSDATVMPGQLRAVNKYMGPENLVVSGQPVDGRSGGGLFSYDGKLVGVCNAADPELNEGLYAAYASVHRLLDDAKLSFVYAKPRARRVPEAIAREPERLPRDPIADRTLSGIRQRDERGSRPAIADDTERTLARGAEGVEPAGAEVICIIRPKNRPDAESQVVVLDRPSRDFINRLNQERTQQDSRQTTQMRIDTRKPLRR